MRSRLTSARVLVWLVGLVAAAAAYAVSYPLGTGWTAFVVAALAFVVFGLVLASVARKFVGVAEETHRAP